jgi:cupin 2 domain-containing protein
VLLLQGEARVSFADAESVTLKSGDYWLIKAHCLHRVEWTTDEMETIWLAVHFNQLP